MYRLSREAVPKGTRGVEVHFTASTSVVTVSWHVEMMVSRHMESISSRKVSKQQSDGYDQQIEQRDEELVSQKGQVVE